MIAIASDQFGIEMKKSIINWLVENEIPVTDFGSESEEFFEHIEYAHAVTGSILDEENVIGVLISDYANDFCMASNKWRGIRASVCWNTEVSYFSRNHQNANIICIPTKYVSIDYAIDILDIFLETEFEGGRYELGVNSINPTF